MIFVYGCDSNPIDPIPNEDFSIYLVKNSENNTPTQKSLNELDLEDEPILSSSSIYFYEWNMHKISYPDFAKERIKSKEPLCDRYYVVIASGQRIYWGVFTDSFSSRSCCNPSIMIWSRNVLDTSFLTNSLTISKSYVCEPEIDLRNDPRILNALYDCGKLK